MKKYSAIEWRVFGKPVTQGSLSSFPYMKKTGGLGVRTPQNKNVLDWRSTVQIALQEEYPELDGSKPLYEKGIPVSAIILVYVAKPKTNKDEHPVNQRSGDIDKYARAIFDACTEYIFHDDSQVTHVTAFKKYVPEEEQGASIMIATTEDGFYPKDCYPDWAPQ